MAIGWGYGANMLAKYLGEEASATPVTAAVCINNPFDLEESTKTSSDTRATDFDQRMTNGFVQILKENQVCYTNMACFFLSIKFCAILSHDVTNIHNYTYHKH